MWRLARKRQRLTVSDANADKRFRFRSLQHTPSIGPPGIPRTALVSSRSGRGRNSRPAVEQRCEIRKPEGVNHGEHRQPRAARMPQLRSGRLPQSRRPIPPSLRRRAGWSAPPLRGVRPRVRHAARELRGSTFSIPTNGDSSAHLAAPYFARGRATSFSSRGAGSWGSRTVRLSVRRGRRVARRTARLLSVEVRPFVTRTRRGP
jgi:hypothetical protein